MFISTAYNQECSESVTTKHFISGEIKPFVDTYLLMHICIRSRNISSFDSSSTQGHKCLLKCAYRHNVIVYTQ